MPRPAQPTREGEHDLPARPSRRTYAKYKPLPFAACTDCHKDPHQNRFGALCVTCHVVEDWKIMKVGQGDKIAFHEKTRYPLRGAHLQVGCEACHGPFEGQAKAEYKDLAFEACTDCHLDAHLGQLGKAGHAAGRPATAATPWRAGCRSASSWPSTRRPSTRSRAPTRRWPATAAT